MTPAGRPRFASGKHQKKGRYITGCGGLQVRTGELWTIPGAVSREDSKPNCDRTKSTCEQSRSEVSGNKPCWWKEYREFLIYLQPFRGSPRGRVFPRAALLHAAQKGPLDGDQRGETRTCVRAQADGSGWPGDRQGCNRRLLRLEPPPSS
jgi:hypothetical protein